MISGQSDTEADLLPDLYRFVWIRFKINHFCFSEKYADFIHRQALLTIRCMDQMGGGGGRRIIVT